MGSATQKGAAQHRLKRLRADVKLDKGGPIAQRVAQLLADPTLPLQAVADRVTKEIKGANTSARSVASVATQLRRDGYDVPDRRHTNGRTMKVGSGAKLRSRAEARATS